MRTLNEEWKLVKVKRSVWVKLMEIKIRKGFKTVSDVIEYLLERAEKDRP